MTPLLYLLLLTPACFAVPSNIYRPCYINDYDCISKTLAANSVCSTQVVGALPKNYTIARFPYDTPFFNATYIDNNLSISDHNACSVYNFFFNLDTGRCVLAIKCVDLTFQSTRTMIQHVAGAEDSIYSFDYKGTYPEIILTANVQPANALDFCNAQVFAYVSVLPVFDIKANDQATDEFLTRDLTFLNIYERETFFYRANELFRFYVNSMLCDFSCDF